MNKSQAETKVYAIYAVFRVDVNNVNKSMVDSNFAFIDPVSAVIYGGQTLYVHTKMIT